VSTDDGPLRAVPALRITAPGRRTGRAHTVPVWFAYRDGHLYFLAHARAHSRGTDWYRNLAAAGTATVTAGDATYRVAHAPFPAGTDPLGATVALFEAKYGRDAVAEWYRPTARIPVRARVVGRVRPPVPTPTPAAAPPR
jgi:deazaflavin-dependent oxidoreductase (nitroreductase family)